MRDIEFRVWDEGEQEMFDVVHIDFDQKVVWYYPEVFTPINASEPAEIEGYSQPLGKAMEYTGLKDRNDTKIFEEDIVSFEHETLLGYETVVGSIIFDKYEAMYTVQYCSGTFPLCGADKDTLEIIGNNRKYL